MRARADALLARRVDLRLALALYESALAGGADVLDVAGNQWRCAMLLGDFASAWRISDAVLNERQRRGLSCGDRPHHLRWVWEGQALSGRHVLVRCYHGLGDVIQFIRFMAPLRAIATQVTVQAARALLPLLVGVEGIDSLVPLGEREEPAFDVDIELMEVPFALRTDLATIPRRVPYLRAAAIPAAARQRELGLRAGLTIGVVWTAGGWRPERSLPLELLLRLVGTADATFVNLQRGAALAEFDQLSASPLREWGDRTEDLVETAATVAALDLVISVDTMIAHLAGALAVPVWTLLHHDSDWRWLTARTDSPWYPTMQLFRQPAPDAWDDVVDEAAAALRDFNGYATIR